MLIVWWLFASPISHLVLRVVVIIWKKNSKWTLCEKCPYSEFFWSVFSRIRTEYGEKRSISVQMRENTNQKNSEYGHFSRSGNETRIRVQSCPGIWILDFLPQFRAEAGFLYVKKCLLEITQISLITWVISLQRNSLSFFITL